PFGMLDRVKMNPQAGSPDLIEPAGPTDPTISIMALREPGGRLISVFSAYSLHYVGGVGGGHISADYYGVYCEALKKLQKGADLDPPFVAILANGTSGDVNNINFRKPGPVKPPHEQIRFVAEDVAHKVNEALAKADWKDEAELQALYREPEIPVRRIDAELLAWAKETEARSKQTPGTDVVVTAYAGRVQQLAAASKPLL